MAFAIEKKLEFPHGFTQRQAIQDLLTAAKHHLKENRKTNEELDILWREVRIVRDPEVSCACADAIVSLAGEGLLDGNKLIAMSVNYSSSADDITCLVYMISQLLHAFCSDKDPKFCCPFSLRMPPHPFISILKSRPNSWHVVHLQTDYMLGNKTSPAVFEMLRPLIFYILLTPESSSEVILTQQNLLNLLFRISSEWNPLGSKLFTKIVWPILIYSTPNIHTIQFYKALALKQFSRADENCATIILLKILKFCSDATSKAAKEIAIKSVTEIVSSCREASIQEELILCGISYILAEFPISVLENALKLLSVFLENSSIVSPIHIAILMATLLQLQLPATTISTKQNIIGLWNNVFSRVKEKFLHQRKKINLPRMLPQVFAPDIFVIEIYSNCYITKKLAVDQEYALIWLAGIEDSLRKGNLKSENVPSVLQNLLGLFLYEVHLHGSSTMDFSELKFVLRCLAMLAKKYPKHSYSILPVVLYALKETQGRVHLDICHLLPSLASHAFCVAPILNVIKVMSTDPSLKVTAIRLMLNLWFVQDRCYPHLLKLLTSTEIGVRKSVNSNDFNVIRAATVATMCKERPHQCGSDMLKLINPMLLLPCNTKCNSLIFHFAQKGIFHLCQSKVLNFVTMWKPIGFQLQSRSDGLHTQNTLEVLSLLPDFSASSSEFENLHDSILSWIWSKVDSKDAETVGAALRCLSHFSREKFRIRHLPHFLQPEIEGEMTEEELMDKQMLGSSFLKLLTKGNFKNKTDFGQLLFSVLEQELRDLPRDIHHRAMKSQLQASQPKSLKAVPEFIMTSYERNKQPSLKSSLAVSLLLCYSCHADLDSGGKPSAKSVITYGRKSMGVLQNLLKEVTIEPNNWQNLFWCAHGWKIFMKKCLASMLEGRRAELSLQKHNLNTSEEMDEFHHKEATASLWCRDKITNALKNASKGNPSMQGNTVFALAGLISAVLEVRESVEESNENFDSEYVKTSHWIVMALDTAMSIGNPKHVPSARIMSWCQYRAVSSAGKLSTTQLGKICAIHALPHLASAVLQKHSGKVLEMLAFLKTRGVDSDDSVEFHCMLSLGHVLSVLFRNNVTDHFESNEVLLVKDCLHILLCEVKNCLSGEFPLQDHLGALLGLGLAISTKFQSPDSSFNTIAKDMVLQLSELFKNEELSPDSKNALSTMLTWTHLSGFSNSILTYKEVSKLLSMLQDAVSDDSTKSGFCESLGTLCNGLFLCGNNEVANMINELFGQWTVIINKQGTPTREKLAALTGCCALMGAETTLSPIAVDPVTLGSTHYLAKLFTLVKSLRQLSKALHDPGIPSQSFLLLGHLYASLESNSSAISSNLPVSYDYLPSTSVLKYVFSAVSEAIKSDSLGGSELVEVLISSIAKSSVGYALPPVNWTTVCSSILVREFTTDAKCAVASILLLQSSASSICASLVTTWISSSKFMNLPEAVSSLFFRNLDVIVKYQEDLKIAEFLEYLGTRCIDLASQCDGRTICNSMLDGLVKALESSSAFPPSVCELLHNTIERLFLHLPFSTHSESQIVIMKKVARCAEYLPDANAILEKSEDEESPTRELLKSLFVRCCCTVNGTHALSMCNRTMLLCGEREDIREDAVHIFGACCLAVREKTNAGEKIGWLREVMGQSRKLIHSEDKSIRQRGQYLLDVFAIAVVIWSYDCVHAPIPPIYDDGVCVSFSCTQTVIKTCRLLLPTSVARLFSSKVWSGFVKPAVDWFSEVVQRFRIEDPHSVWIPMLLGAISASKNTESYQRPPFWCDVVTTVCEAQAAGEKLVDRI